MATDAVKQARKFVIHHHGRAVFAPFTGQDSRAWVAFVDLLELYAAADSLGRARALLAMAATIDAMQAQCRWIAKVAIPSVLDWGDEEPLWKRIADNHELAAAIA